MAYPTPDPFNNAQMVYKNMKPTFNIIFCHLQSQKNVHVTYLLAKFTDSGIYVGMVLLISSFSMFSFVAFLIYMDALDITIPIELLTKHVLDY